MSAAHKRNISFNTSMRKAEKTWCTVEVLSAASGDACTSVSRSCLMSNAFRDGIHICLSPLNTDLKVTRHHLEDPVGISEEEMDAGGGGSGAKPAQRNDDDWCKCVNRNPMNYNPRHNKAQPVKSYHFTMHLQGLQGRYQGSGRSLQHQLAKFNMG